jgi:hypothetical protein
VIESYRPLAWFWAGAVSFIALGAATLQVIGPPSRGPESKPTYAASAVPSPPAGPLAAHATVLPAPTPAPKLSEDAAASAAARAPGPADSSPLEPPRPAAASTPASLPQPSHSKAQAPVRKHRVVREPPNLPGTYPDIAAAEQGQLWLPRQGSRPSLPPVASSPPAQAAPYQRSASYIGVYTTGGDGVRTFRSTP